MDHVVRQNSSLQWTLEDLLGRTAGHIELGLTGTYRVVVAERGLARLSQISPGPYLTLESALAEIERHTRGTCMLRSLDPPQTSSR
jgi:hypothetical protein